MAAALAKEAPHIPEQQPPLSVPQHAVERIRARTWNDHAPPACSPGMQAYHSCASMPIRVYRRAIRVLPQYAHAPSTYHSRDADMVRPFPVEEKLRQERRKMTKFNRGWRTPETMHTFARHRGTVGGFGVRGRSFP